MEEEEGRREVRSVGGRMRRGGGGGRWEEREGRGV